MPMEEFAPPLRRQQTNYLQPYDLEYRHYAQGLGDQIAQARAMGVHGAGGLSGAAMQRQIGAEGRFENAIALAQQRREMQERARLAREAAIRQQMKNQSIANYAGAGANIGSAIVSGVIGGVNPGLQGSDMATDRATALGGLNADNFQLGGRAARRFDLGG
jgi:hypothetical protein